MREELLRYEQLAAELRKHGDKAQHYIIMHDTAMPFVYEDCNSYDMMSAIGHFIRSGHWLIKSHELEACGLTVLERVR